MIKKRMIYLLGAVLLIAGCTKEPLPQLNDPNAPEYGFKGNIDGEAFEVEVGDGDANLSFGTSELNGIQTYYGQIDAPSEDFTMRIEVLRPERMPADLTSEGLEIIKNDPEFFVHNPACIRLDF